MLILTRRVNETVMIGDDVTVTVLSINHNQVRLGVNAPRHVPVHREEIYNRIQDDDEAAPADNACIRQGRRIAAGFGAGQGKTRDILTAREARQVVILLCLRAVVQQQLGGPEGVGHHDGYRRRDAAARDFHDDFRVGVGRKLQSAELARNNHAEEAFSADEAPDVRRHYLRRCQFDRDLR